MSSWDKIIDLLNANGLNKRDLSAICSVRPSAITKWARGGGIDAQNIAKIAIHFGVTSDWILGVSDENEKMTTQSNSAPVRNLNTSKKLKISEIEKVISDLQKDFQKAAELQNSSIEKLRKAINDLKEE